MKTTYQQFYLISLSILLALNLSRKKGEHPAEHPEHPTKKSEGKSASEMPPLSKDSLIQEYSNEKASASQD